MSVGRTISAFAVAAFALALAGSAPAQPTDTKEIAKAREDARGFAEKGLDLVDQGKYAEAEEISKKALSLNPNYAEAHKNQGIVWLLLGDFERGWSEYEWRWRCPGCTMPAYQAPLWDGTSLAGKTVLLHHEQA